MMQPPRLPSFFRIPKPKQFNYKPVYFDERKAQLQERIRRIEKEVALEKDPEKGKLAGLRMKRDMEFNRTFYQKQHKKSNLRLILIASLLALLTYLFLR